MDLAERLRRLGYAPAAAPPRAAPGRGVPIDQVVRGAYRDTPHGRCFVAKATYSLRHEHGGVALGDLLALSCAAPSSLTRLPPSEELDWRQAAFLDTETTGLAGGTGTYVFLVGLGYVEADHFHVEQYFMCDYGEELAMLSALGERLTGFSALVSFNGKVFDWPLLQTRYGMYRESLPLGEPLHLDILFPARRLWRERLGSCCLSSLEDAVLGLKRAVDVPSWLIPSIYFGYVRDRDARPLQAVFAHNEQDILSLVSLTVLLARHFTNPLAAGAHPIDVYSLGRALESAADWQGAVLCYEKALAAELPSRLRADALCRLGLVYKRLKQAENAQQIWRSLVARPEFAGILPHVELAKHLEHRERDYAAAAAAVERALRVWAGGHPAYAGEREARERRKLEHRLARLRQKLAGEAERMARHSGLTEEASGGGL